MKRFILLLLLLGPTISIYAELSITLHIETAGGLYSMIATSKKYQITSLILTGKLNGSDIKFIREMTGTKDRGNYTEGQLNYLDISGVDIVKGGDYYAFEHYQNGYSSKKFYTSDNTITPFMFDDCHQLKTLILPNSVNTIEADAFWNSNLSSITLPKNLENYLCIIPSFYLSEIKISSENNNFKIVDGVLFSYDMKTLYRCPTDYSKETFVVQKSVENIYGSAFYNCQNIKKINYPPTLKTFGYRALAWMDLNEFAIYPNVVYSSLGSFTSIEEVEIKDGFSTFNARIFGLSGDYRYSTHIERIKINCSTPPAIADGYSFNQETLKGSLYVPKGSYSAYYIAFGWGDFASIYEMDGEDEKKYCEKPIINFSNKKIFFNNYTVGSIFHTTITCNDVKNTTENEIDLDAIYNISVYATANGYEPSEVVTAKLYWINATFDPTDIQSEQANTRGIVVQSDNGCLTISGLDNNEQVSLYSLSGKLLGNIRALS